MKLGHALRASAFALAWLLASKGATAVEVASSGVGQVLLFPYYTVGDPGSGAFASLVTITNETERVKALRVRFREGREGESVLEFNLYLAGRDAWVGAVIADADGASLVTPDRSCTSPALSSDEFNATRLGTNALTGGEVVPRSRAREGYIEVIEMGDYGLSADAPPDSIAAAVTHQNSVPIDCARVENDNGLQAAIPTGGLSGFAVQISVSAGLELAQAATALVNFNTQRVLFARPNTGLPTLADAGPPVSVIHDPAIGTIRTIWSEAIDAVSAVLMRSAVNGDFIIEPATGSQTAWVLTMPTRQQHVVSPTQMRPPFVPHANGGRCQNVENEYAGTLFGREANTQVWTGGFVGGSAPRRAFCWSTTVVDFNAPPELFQSANRYTWMEASSRPPRIEILPSIGVGGWMRLPLHSDIATSNVIPSMSHVMVGGISTIFRSDGSLETRPSMTLFGLPVIGFAATTFRNGNVGGTLSNYAGSVPLRYELRVEWP